MESVMERTWDLGGPCCSRWDVSGNTSQETPLQPLGPSTILYTTVQVHFLYWIILAIRSQALSTALTSCVLSLSRHGDVSRALPYVTLEACLITRLCPSFQTRGPYSSSKAVLGQLPLSGLCKQRPSSLCLPRQKDNNSWHRVPGAARPWLCFSFLSGRSWASGSSPVPAPAAQLWANPLPPASCWSGVTLTGSPMKGPHVEAG